MYPNEIVMLISIIVPTYKPQAYLYECFESLESQTAGLHAFEMIVILNGEREPYFTEIQRYLSNSSLNSRLLYTPVNGASNARNIALDSLDSGQNRYVVFLDDDDKLSPNFIEEMAKHAQPGVIVASNSESFYDNEPNKRLPNAYVGKCHEKNFNKDYDIFSYRCFLSTVWGKIIPVDMIGKTRFNTRFAIGEDSLFSFALSNKIEKMILTPPDAYYLRRVRSESVSRKPRSRFSIISNGLKLCLAYTTVYLRNPFGYHFLFFISRIVATFMTMFRSRKKVTI